MAKVADDTRERSLLDQLSDAVIIDKHNLDEAWVEQPDIFWRVSDQLARARNNREKAKLARDQVITTVGAQMREDAEAAVEKAGKGRVSETALSRDIELDDRVQQARADYQRHVYTVDRWEALKESFSQRSYALKDLTGLHIANYYQTNSGGDRREQAAGRVREQVGQVHRDKAKG